MTAIGIVIGLFIMIVLFLVGMMVGYTMGSIRRAEKNFEKKKVSASDISRLEFIAYSIRDEISSDTISKIDQLIKEYKRIVEKVYQSR